MPRDIYKRIKKLEDKILELEGMSPEYFQSVVSIVSLKHKYVFYFRILHHNDSSLIDMLSVRHFLSYVGEYLVF